MKNLKELKNKELLLDCLRFGSNLEGIAAHEGYTLFVEGALPGEKVRARVERCEKRYGYAKSLEVLEKSPHRVEPQCPYFYRCGGCSAQHIAYGEQLQAKSAMVQDYFRKNAKIDFHVPKTLGLGSPWHSRNKSSLPVRNVNGEMQIGFYRRRSHRIVDIESCPIAMECLPNILTVLRRWIYREAITAYHEESNTGQLRHVMIRNTKSGEIMVVLVSNTKKLFPVDSLVKELKKEIAGFVSLYQNINTQKNNVILGVENHLLYGKKVLEQEICGLTFEISPLSFMQVNSQLTDVLYQIALDMANVTDEDFCIDAYAGAGTISLILAKRAKEVIGIEMIADAVKNARENAERNKLENVSFICGKVEEELPKLVEQGKRPSLVLLDPPRKGVDSPVLESLQKSLPQKILYISCNPATQARDIAELLPYGYQIQAVQPVDMFCMSSEVENILFLQRK